MPATLTSHAARPQPMAPDAGPGATGRTPAPATPVAPVVPVATPVPPAGLNCRRIDVAKLVAEINSDLTRLNDELVAAQADATAAHAAYSSVAAAGDRAYNDLLARHEREREEAFAAKEAAAAAARGRWQAAAAIQAAAEDRIGGEIKYVVGLVGGDPSATRPTLREAPAA